MSDTNEAIIDTDTFEQVKEMVISRHFDYINNNEFLSKKIYCGKCSATFKLKKSERKRYWGCRTHDKKASLCDNGWLPEGQIFEAFMHLYNKLLFNYKNILVPLRNSLWELKQRDMNVNGNMIELHKEIAKLKEQTHLIARLRTKGFLDEEKYLSQSNEIGMKINKLRTELKKLTQDDDDDTLEQLDMLIDIFENQTEPMIDFEEREFDSIIERITAMGGGRLQFHLIGGLKFTEKI